MRSLLVQPPPYERRTPEQLFSHYEIEKELANRLRQSRPEDRSALYSSVYDELFRRVPSHPQLTRGNVPGEVEAIVETKMRLLNRFLRPDTVFLELGAGDCRLSMEAARHVSQAYALDVSDEVTKCIEPPPNFQLILSNGTDIPLPDNSVTVAYSYQLMEHIHPDDVILQLRHIHRVLASGGIYVCITPNRLTGPHDISRYFDHEATGFHLKEYTLGDLRRLFRAAGCSKVWGCPGLKGRFAEVPLLPMILVEKAVDRLPWGLKRRIARAPLIENILLAAVVAQKA